MRIRNSKPAPARDFFRKQRLRANRFQTPKAVTHNGAKFIIAANGMRIPLNLAVENQLPDAEAALRRAGAVIPLSALTIHS